MNSQRYIKKTYDKFAKEYHNKRLDLKKGFWNERVESPALISLSKPHIKNKDILELGCGSGLFIKKILKYKPKSITGFDLSEGLLKLAKESYPEIKFFQGSVEKTPFKKNMFNTVISGLTLHYIKDLMKVFKEVNRILRLNGNFIFSIHHPLMECLESENKSHKNFFLSAYNHNNEYKWKMMEGMELISYHHTFEYLINGLIKSGFAIQYIKETYPDKLSKKIHPEEYEKAIKYPAFLVMEVKKVNSSLNSNRLF